MTDVSRYTLNVDRDSHREELVDCSVPTDLSVNLGPNASLDLYIMADKPETAFSQCRMEANLTANSRLNVYIGMLNTSEASNHITVNLNEPGAHFEVKGFVLLKDNDKGSNTVNVNHRAPHCTSNQLLKYIVDNSAIGYFHGLIRVYEGATGTQAYQNNRNILAGKQALMHSEPQLEIYCDDVKCSHGAATGQLDQLALFYMRSRGIDLATARSMLMHAFIDEVIEDIPREDLCKNLLTETELLLSDAVSDSL